MRRPDETTSWPTRSRSVPTQARAPAAAEILDTLRS
jgi:hypothetical protein